MDEKGGTETKKDVLFGDIKIFIVVFSLVTIMAFIMGLIMGGISDAILMLELIIPLYPLIIVTIFLINVLTIKNDPTFFRFTILLIAYIIFFNFILPYPPFNPFRNESSQEFSPLFYMLSFMPGVIFGVLLLLLNLYAIEIVSYYKIRHLDMLIFLLAFYGANYFGYLFFLAIQYNHPDVYNHGILAVIMIFILFIKSFSYYKMNKSRTEKTTNVKSDVMNND
jgi:hypothetical protein